MGSVFILLAATLPSWIVYRRTSIEDAVIAFLPLLMAAPDGRADATATSF